MRRISTQAPVLAAARLHAALGTRIEPYLALEAGFLPPSKASCGIMFHEIFVPAF